MVIGLGCQGYNTMKNEVIAYGVLAGGKVIPKVHWFGEVGHYNTIIMEMLGPSLTELFQMCGRTFSLKTVLMLADQLLYGVEYVHSKGILHGNIKPDNLLMGMERKSHTLHIVDYGLAEPYWDWRTEEHIAWTDQCNSVRGSLRYISVRAHQGIQPSRRDELESVIYVLMHWSMGGKLPWPGSVDRSDSDMSRKIMRAKVRSTAPGAWDERFPQVFAGCVIYCRALKFQARVAQNAVLRTKPFGILQTFCFRLEAERFARI